jgi:hypothetical protein
MMKEAPSQLAIDDGTQLRINTDGTVRIERPITIGRKRREIIHFNPD